MGEEPADVVLQEELGSREHPMSDQEESAKGNIVLVYLMLGEHQC